MNRENRKYSTYLNRNIEGIDHHLGVSVINTICFYFVLFFTIDPGCYDLTKNKKNQTTIGTTQPSHTASTTIPKKNVSSHLERYIYTV